MSKVTVFAGLDYATSFVQVCVLDRSGQQLGNRRCDNDATAIDRYLRSFGNRVEAAIEACTGAANLAEELAQLPGWRVNLAHAGYVKRIKQNPDKTDYSDARLLADLQRVGYLPKVWLAPEAIRELRGVVRYRQQLANQKRACKVRVGAVLREHRIRPPAGTTWTLRWRRWLQTVELPRHSRWVVNQHVLELESLERRLKEVAGYLERLTADDPEVARLLTQKGIGLITACVLRAEIGQFDRFRSGKQLARFCGVSPRNASSGDRQADAGLIKAGNPHLRATIIETAHRLMRLEPRWQEMTYRLLAAGKKKSVIGAAVANRWIRWLYHEMQEMKAA